MKTHSLLLPVLVMMIIFFSSCEKRLGQENGLRYQFADILDIRYTPDTAKTATGWFTDQGAWMGFTLPENEKWINGFCGPFDLEYRQWMSPVLLQLSFAGDVQNIQAEKFTPDSSTYFPGELYLSATSSTGTINQRLIFLDSYSTLLQCSSETEKPLQFFIQNLPVENTVRVEGQSVVFSLPMNRELIVTFSPTDIITVWDNGISIVSGENGRGNAIISFTKDMTIENRLCQKAEVGLERTARLNTEHEQRWEGYLNKILRTDMPEKYNRVAVKSVVTLLSNWFAPNKGFTREGIVPSHAVDYFVGYWAWDSWKHAAAIATFAPELAKNHVRGMFDYQMEDGMIIDCIFPDTTLNNARDSKPPLAAWAVEAIFNATSDSAFVKEMYPKLLSYHRWWYQKRDHNQNGICEFGSCDGSLAAAAWESGMDNAIRFDHAEMVKNSEGAWSFNQESVDLNAFLSYEYGLLKKLAPIAGSTFDDADKAKDFNDYFFDQETGFFFDRRLVDGSFVTEAGSEAYVPIWTGLATKSQMERMLPILQDTSRFSTFIPFPTVAADNPKFMPKGYWRGPIWLDQTYFAISGLRKYGYGELSDKYTMQVFDRLVGLTGNGAIHENYGTHTGEQLKAPHFSWSSAHLLMLYTEYGS